MSSVSRRAPCRHVPVRIVNLEFLCSFYLIKPRKMVIIFINQLFMICVVFECLSLSVKALKDDIVGEAVAGVSCAKMQMAVEVSVFFYLCCKIIYLRSIND